MQYCDGKANPQNLIILAFILPYKHGIQLRVNDINKNAESLTKGLQQTQNYQQIYLLWICFRGVYLCSTLHHSAVSELTN
jgi:hypothetical protein